MVDEEPPRRKWIPWTRETDEKAKLWGTILGILGVVVASGSGVLRVDRFGYSDFEKRISLERAITESKIAEAVHEREQECIELRSEMQYKLKGIEQFDAVLNESLKAGRDAHIQLMEDFRDLRTIVHDFQRRPHE